MTKNLSAPGSPVVILLGINHNTAPIEVRERLAIAPSRLADATRALAHQPGIREAIILSTCNRVELLTVQDAAHSENPGTLNFLYEYLNIPASDLQPHLYEFREREAVRHLFRVASSLDSMVVGEPQILGQVKEAYTTGREVGAVATTLEGLLQRAFTVAKRVRTDTQIGSSSVSIASVAVDLARKIFDSLEGKTVLLVGAGKMSELAARHLIQQGAASILVANRTQSRAEQIAKEFNGQIIPFDQLYEQADRADIVITSTGAPQKIFSRSHGQQFLHRRRNRPMFFIDIAVPRDVDPGMNEVEGCFVYDIDDLQQVAQANLADRSREAEAAEAIVTREVDKYLQRLQTLNAVPAIQSLQQYAEAIRQAELRRSQSKLAGLTPEQREAVDVLTRSLTAKFLHHPLTGIRQAAQQGDSQTLADLQRLYTGQSDQKSDPPTDED
ncbi:MULTISPECIES: glutamyl-tRNA reductase [Acidobacteriaceae]|uniref:glutamyl-tRNA reductase n=1 Tax=Acidobacteriaceae TaxID=204434 RepID=UPI00131C062F|nr:MULTISPECIES: glutamyl-tRNA reductase [Acidobacteriaceae]MDW5266024.1 glutamyl-tRNA reductase [Edaphobacter sp.]